MSYIYTLIDPRDCCIRYVGKTNVPSKRYRGHLAPSKLKNNSYKNNWLKELLLSDLRPIIDIVEECSEENWQERERYWISYYKSSGHNLTNVTDGGEGGNTRGGKILSEQTKKKISETHMGANNPMFNKSVSFETREKLSDSLRGKKKNKETSSKYLGVFWNKDRKKWMSLLTLRGKSVYNGLYEKEVDAAVAYNDKAKELFGSKAVMNVI